MKVNGIEAKSAWEPEPVVLDRGKDANGKRQFLVFRARGLQNLDELEDLLPHPKSSAGKFTRTGWEADEEAPAHLEDLKRWRNQRWGYIVAKTLEPSKIEWKTVDLTKPKTWLNVDAELRESLSYTELGLVYGLVNEANALDPEKLEENRQTFFQTQQEASALISQDSDQENSASGEPVSEPEYTLQE